MRFLRKSWPIWAIWGGTALFIAGLAINPFWTFAVIWTGIMVGVFVTSIRAAIEMARESEGEN